MDDIIGCFFEKRKDLIHNTKQIADRDIIFLFLILFQEYHILPS